MVCIGFIKVGSEVLMNLIMRTLIAYVDLDVEVSSLKPCFAHLPCLCSVCPRARAARAAMRLASAPDGVVARPGPDAIGTGATATAAAAAATVLQKASISAVASNTSAENNGEAARASSREAPMVPHNMRLGSAHLAATWGQRRGGEGYTIHRAWYRATTNH